MPEAEGYVGIIKLLTDAIDLMDPGEARGLVVRARAETAKLMRQSVSSLEMGIELGQLLSGDARPKEERP